MQPSVVINDSIKSFSHIELGLSVFVEEHLLNISRRTNKRGLNTTMPQNASKQFDDLPRRKI